MEYPQEILDRLNAITSKRPATVIRHLLEHEQITTDELRDKDIGILHELLEMFVNAA